MIEVSALKNSFKVAVGRLAELLLPHLARDIDENRNTRRAARLKQAIIYARTRRATSHRDADALEKSLASFWKEQSGDKFHAEYIDLRFDTFKKHHAGLIEAFAAQIEAGAGPFKRIVEIGCGDGKVLDYCAKRLPQIGALVGLDINASALARASRDFAGTERLTFVEADGLDWLAAHPRAGTALLTYGGVLEYFAQARVETLFQVLAAQGPAAIVIAEPLAPEHDLEAEQNSLIFGREHSFSHNYPDQFRKAGFRLAYHEEMEQGWTRWILAVGIAGRPG